MAGPTPPSPRPPSLRDGGERSSAVFAWLAGQKQRKIFLILLGLLAAGGAAVAGWWGYRHLRPESPRAALAQEWAANPQQHPDWAVKAGQRCGSAPFLIPSDGFMGFLWGDTFNPAALHQGIDIFSGQEPGHAPVVAAAAGYLTRLAGWKSSVIIRLPSDPLQPERQIWTYYTHLADSAGNSLISAQFPPDTREVFVEAGTVLGTQGNYSGTPGNPVWVHLHFSIVLDDGQGGFKNELKIENTLDPSPYLGLPLNIASNPSGIPVCPAASD